MAPDLRHEIHQKRPFKSLYQEAELNIIRTAAVLGDGFTSLFKKHGLTSAQYNVLRILRGAEPDGLCRNDLRDRMLTRMPDMTRLIDRMERDGLVRREKDSSDKRLVFARITAKAIEKLRKLDDLVAIEHESQLGHLHDDELRTLVSLLGKARNAGK